MKLSLSPQDHIDHVEAIKAYNKLIEQEPEHSELSEDESYKLVPIAFLEPDLRFVYEGCVQVIIKSQKEIFGAICMHIRLKVLHPVYKKWLKYDGTAAVMIEGTQPGEYKGSSKTMVLENIKTGIAQCYSEALKNAAKKIGPRFGSDLNRVRKPGAAVVSAYDKKEDEPNFVFDKNGQHTKKQLLQLIAADKISVETMNEYLANRK